MTPEIIASIFKYTQTIVSTLFGISLFWQLIEFVNVVASAHKDTAGVRLLNILISTALFFNIENIIKGWLLLLVQIIILIINYCINEYLKRNKYYS